MLSPIETYATSAVCNGLKTEIEESLCIFWERINEKKTIRIFSYIVISGRDLEFHKRNSINSHFWDDFYSLHPLTQISLKLASGIIYWTNGNIIVAPVCWFRKCEKLPLGICLDNRHYQAEIKRQLFFKLRHLHESKSKPDVSQNCSKIEEIFNGFDSSNGSCFDRLLRLTPTVSATHLIFLLSVQIKSSSV